MHHTKSKGDIGLANVISDLTEKGYVPCVPLSEHQPYDLLAVHSNGTVAKLQVKFVSLKNNGTIELRFRLNWSDAKATHSKAYGENEFDYYALYCPEKKTVLYVSNTIDCPKALRFDKPRNNQESRVRWANEYLDMK